MANVGFGVASGVLGGIAGGANAYNTNKNIRKSNSALTGLQGTIGNQYNTISSGLTDSYSPYTENATADYNSYRDALNNANYKTYGDDTISDYDLAAKTKEFLDPTVDYQTEQATNAVQGSAANRGGLFSSQTGRAISDRASAIAKTAYNEALQTALSDRDYQLDKENTQIGLNRSAIDQYNSNLNSQLANKGTLAGLGQNASLGLADTLASLQSNTYGQQNTLESQKIANNSQKQSVLGGIMSGIGSGISSMFGGK